MARECYLALMRTESWWLAEGLVDRLLLGLPAELGGGTTAASWLLLPMAVPSLSATAAFWPWAPPSSTEETSWGLSNSSARPLVPDLYLGWVLLCWSLLPALGFKLYRK